MLVTVAEACATLHHADRGLEWFAAPHNISAKRVDVFQVTASGQAFSYRSSAEILPSVAKKNGIQRLSEEGSLSSAVFSKRFARIEYRALRGERHG